MNDDIVLHSPDRKHRAELSYESEIRYGPAYFRLSIDGEEVKDRIFGKPLAWSDNSQFLAAQEWLTTDYQKGPITRVVLFDLVNRRYSNLGVVDNGFAESFSFDGQVLIYHKHYPAQGFTAEVEIELSMISNWGKYEL